MPNSSTHWDQSPNPPRLYMAYGVAFRSSPQSRSCPRIMSCGSGSYGIPERSFSRTRIDLVRRSMCFAGIANADIPSGPNVSSTPALPYILHLTISVNIVSQAVLSMSSEISGTSSPDASWNVSSEFVTASILFCTASLRRPSIMISSKRLYRDAGLPASAARRAARHVPTSETLRSGALIIIWFTTGVSSFLLSFLVSSISVSD